MAIRQEDSLKQKLGNVLAEQCVAIRDRRRTVEEQWLKNRRMWMNKDLDRRYVNSDTSSGPYDIPAGRRSSERTIIRTVRLLTPTVKWFDVTPMNDVSDKNAQNVDKYMNFVLRKKIRSRSNIGQLARSIYIAGLCTQKTTPAVRNNQVWPLQRVVDPFAFYIYPETASIVGEADVQFEDFLFSYEKYKTFVAKGMVDDVDRSDISEPDWPYHLVERLAYQGITSQGSNVDREIDKVSGQLKRTTSAYCSLTEQWITHEDKLYQVYHLWNHTRGPKCVGFFQSQYNEPLYRTAVHRGLAGELYTNSMSEDVTDLNLLQNDLVNKFLEAVDREQGFFAILANRRHDSWKHKGGAIWLFDDDPRAAMQFIQPPVTSTNILRAWQIVSGMVNAAGGTGSIAEGQPGRNMPRSGQAVGQLLEMGMADIQDVAELIEQEVLTLGLSDIYKVSEQFIPDQQLLRVPGGAGISSSGRQMSGILRREDILGDYEFDWIGSLQSQDHAQRAQESMIFLQLLANPQTAQQLNQAGYTVNFVELIKSIWRDKLGEHGLADILLPISDMEKEIRKTEQESNDDSKKSVAVPGLSYDLPSLTNGYMQK